MCSAWYFHKEFGVSWKEFSKFMTSNFTKISPVLGALMHVAILVDIQT